ncbi:MAG: divalent-cation tolerance protein CutA [Nitrososphaerota archaeon]|nr:divalent-cation tolerance protein CutA [Nitrososphaerota archaeon]
MTTDFIVVLVTTKNKAEAEKISQTLLEQKLVACANIVSPLVSRFLWQGKIDKAEECLIIMKSRADLFTEILQHVRILHSYEVPEVLALPVVFGSTDYLDWIQSVLKQ